MSEREERARKMAHRRFSADTSNSPLSTRTDTALLESSAPTEYSSLVHSQSTPIHIRTATSTHSPSDHQSPELQGQGDSIMSVRNLSCDQKTPRTDIKSTLSSSYHDPIAAGSQSTLGSTLQPSMTQEATAGEGQASATQADRISTASSNAPQEKHHDLRRIWRKHGFDMPPSDAQLGFCCLLLFVTLHGFGMQLPALLGLPFYVLCGVRAIIYPLS